MREDEEMDPSFFISPANHIYCDLSKELITLDMEGANSRALNIGELMMPGNHCGLVNAHARFEELNSHFLKLLDHSLELRALNRADVLPGEVKTR